MYIYMRVRGRGAIEISVMNEYDDTLKAVLCALRLLNFYDPRHPSF